MAPTKVTGIILNRFEFRETSVIVHLLTENCGKIAGLMKGVRSEKKKVAPLVYQQGSLIEAQVYLRWQPGLELISQPNLLVHFPFKGEALFFWKKILELMDKLVPQGRQDTSDLFRLLVSTSEAVPQTGNLNVLEAMFMVRALSVLGFGPFLDRCLSCGSAEHLRYFSGKLGGVVCANCRTKEPDAFFFPFKHLEILRFLRRLSLNQTSVVKYLPETVYRNFRRCFNGIISYHIG